MGGSRTPSASARGWSFPQARDPEVAVVEVLSQTPLSTATDPCRPTRSHHSLLPWGVVESGGSWGPSPPLGVRLSPFHTRLQVARSLPPVGTKCGRQMGRFSVDVTRPTPVGGSLQKSHPKPLKIRVPCSVLFPRRQRGSKDVQRQNSRYLRNYSDLRRVVDKEGLLHRIPSTEREESETHGWTLTPE